jgi:hypothetical protein
MSWFFDGRLVGTVGSWYSAQGGAMPKPFDVPFHMIMNLAIGGDFDGGRKPPETWTESEMKVDWVRVWEWDNNLTTRQLPPSSEISTPVDDTGSTYPAGSDGGNNGPHGVPGSSGGEGGGTSANLCLNKPATASSFEPNSTLGAIEAKYAVDGNTTGTRWGSVEDGNPNTQEWLKIDLEKVEELKEIKIFWEAANAKEYKVSLSADDATYTEVFHETAGSENVNYDKTIDVTGKSARYIKIDCLVKNPAWQGNYYGYSIWEVEAYGPASAIVAPESGRWQVIQNSGSLTVPQAQSLKIYSLSGKLLAKATGNSLPIASLQGVYVLKAMKNNTEQSMKVIIK